MIRMTRIDVARNMKRFYALDVQPTLFGEWTLVTEWGRIGQGGTIRIESFDNKGQAELALHTRERLKHRRGYQ